MAEGLLNFEPGPWPGLGQLSCVVPSMRWGWVVLWSLLLGQGAWAQSSSELYQKLKKLQVLGSVLYIAAHPDDENTQVLARLSRGDLYETAYLSLTRGDGGQNLIGTELRESLGLLRTQELLRAREIDGAGQYFSRANDFGFCKHPDEALKLWDRDQVLEDIGTVIGRFQPDVVITRFSTEPGVTHGHHTASAILAAQAFRQAANPPTRLVWNVIEDMPGERRVDTSGKKVISLDINGHSPLLGLSFPELAARSLSAHRSQGFGSAAVFNRPPARFVHLDGVPAQQTLFDGIDTSWNRLAGAQRIGERVSGLLEKFDFQAPHKSVPGLLSLRRELQSLSPSVWKTRKLREVDSLIEGCLGLQLSATTSQAMVTPGAEVPVTLTVIARAPMALRWTGARVGRQDIAVQRLLARDVSTSWEGSYAVAKEQPYSHPYWLKEPYTRAGFQVSDEDMRGLAQAPAAFPVSFRLEVAGEALEFQRELEWFWVDPKEGPQKAPLAVVPPASLTVQASPLLCRHGESKTVTVTVEASSQLPPGELRLQSPEGWLTQPTFHETTSLEPGQQRRYQFTVTAPEVSSAVTLRPILTLPGQQLEREVRVISYPHIPRQVMNPACELRALSLDLAPCRGKVGYLAGAGDELAPAIQALGYQVVELQPSSRDFSQLKAIVLGVRAFNTVEKLRPFRDRLDQYVEEGGVVVLNYNRPSGLKAEPFGLTLTKTRVTDETATIQFLAPAHPLLNQPNRIGSADFEGWVQERGLYFPASGAADYRSLLRMADPGEAPSEQALLVKQQGQGFIVYNALALFRQLPAGVPGAYRLLANMLSLQGASEPATEKLKR